MPPSLAFTFRTYVAVGTLSLLLSISLWGSSTIHFKCIATLEVSVGFARCIDVDVVCANAVKKKTSEPPHDQTPSIPGLKTGLRATLVRLTCRMNALELFGIAGVEFEPVD